MSDTPSPKMSPIFVKGHLNFTYKGQNFEFPYQPVSCTGISGLPWGTLDPVLDLGQKVQATIRTPNQEPLTLKTSASITGEKTTRGGYMGLRFKLDAEQKELLAKHIRAHGFIPTNCLRKYPRIPSLTIIQTFPSRCLVFPPEGILPSGNIVLSLDVENLSPNGVLLSSENQSVLNIEPGMRINLILEPRGWFPTPIKAHGQVCRISDESCETSGNVKRSLGVRFLKVDETNRAAFVDLLKSIIQNLEKVKKNQDL